MKSFNKISLSLLCAFTINACGSSSDTSNPNPPPDIGLTDPTALDFEDYVVYDQYVTSAAQSSLTKDLIRVDQSDLSTGTDNDAALQSLLQVNSLSPYYVAGWLKYRIHYLIGPDLSQYRIGLVVPSEKQIHTEALPADDDPDSSQNTAASMIGTALYLFSTSERTRNPAVSYATIQVNGSWIHGNTQRNGVVQIGPALFDPNFQPNPDPDAYSSSVLRISTLFHEARHADGNRRAGSLGFPHVICPRGSGVAPELVGQPACDSAANGAYMVGFHVLKAYATQCGTQCSTRDRTLLNALLLDNLSRVIQPAGKTLPVLDATPDPGFAVVDISDFAEIAE